MKKNALLKWGFVRVDSGEKKKTEYLGKPCYDNPVYDNPVNEILRNALYLRVLIHTEE
jgi:hypothetical protein